MDSDRENRKRGMAMILPITLTAAGVAALINLWLAIRVGRVRTAEKINMGDGGNDRLIGAMRAQANFVEYTPFVLILIAAIEMATGTTWWLWAAMAAYMLARVAHGVGMTGKSNPFRGIGILVTMLVLLGLAVTAIAIPYLSFGRITATEVMPAG